MLLIIGLGNPGKKYQKTRHNAGFKVVEEIAIKFAFPEFKFYLPLEAEISERMAGQKKVVIAKPQTFMNSSGEAVKKIIKKWGISAENLIVVHDDLDIVIGKIKISKNRGAAGHKGVDSIIKELKTKDFTRFRIGIQPKTGKPKNPEKFVLQNFAKKEQQPLESAFKEIISTIGLYLK
jgi:peptidyl-tRNA hydrolase, PTH1 family